MGVISFRLPDDDEERLRRAGVNPGARAKELLEADLKQLRIQESLAVLDAFRAKHRATKPVEDIIREIRDEH